MKTLLKTLETLHPLMREIDRRIKPGWVMDRCAISPLHTYAYFRIPKCANSTIMNTLAHYDPSVQIEDMDDKGKSSKGAFQDLRAAKALTPGSFAKKYTLFTFVRNPYSRVLSAYLDKIVPVEKQRYNEIRGKVAGYSGDSQTTFGGFIRYLEEEGLYSDPHWAPQTALIPVHPSRLSFVGKIENLDEDLGVMVGKLFGEGRFEGTIDRVAGRTNASRRSGDYYTDDLHERVYTLYRRDFDQFAYPQQP